MNKIILTAFLSLLVVGCASGGGTSQSARSHVKLQNSQVVKTELKKQEKQWRGTPYRLGGNSMQGIDCSGFVQRTFTDKFAIRLPRTTTAQTSQGVPVKKSDLRPGDLVFFKTNWGSSGLHVGIYSGNNQFVHASTTKGVMTSSINEKYWKQRFYQARRLQHGNSASTG